MRTVPLLATGLVALTLVVFQSVRGHEFVDYDDTPVVVENPHVVGGLTWENVRGAFLEPHYANWTPLSWISLQIDRSLFGESAGAVLLHNLLQHVLATVLLFLAFARMTCAPWPSAFVAAVFAVHPLHVESVAWASERRDTLSGLLWMSTLVAYVYYAGRPGARRYGLVVLAFVAGLLAKPVLVTLPFVLLLLDHWPLRRLRHDRVSGKPEAGPTRRAVLEKLPLLALALVASAVTLVAQREGGAIRLGGDAFPLGLRIQNAVVSYAVYLREAFWPVDLAAFHPFPIHGLATGLVVSCAAVLAVVGGIALGCWRAQPAVFVGAAWFFGTLVPMIGLVSVGHQAHADRYTYIPLVGIAVALAFPVAELAARRPKLRRVLAVAGAVALAGLAVAAARQVAVWRDTVTLFAHTARVTEDNFFATHRLAVAHRRLGNVEQADAFYRETLRAAPTYVRPKVELATWLHQRGRGDEAIPLLRDALQLRRGHAQARRLLAVTLLEVGRFEEAHAELRNALLHGEDPQLRAGLGIAAAMLGRRDEALRHYREALSLDPDQIGAANNLAWALATDPDPARRAPAEAVRMAQQALERAPDSPDLLDTLAAAYAASGRFDAAVETGARAVARYEREGMQAQAEASRARLLGYRAGAAYVESPPSGS